MRILIGLVSIVLIHLAFAGNLGCVNNPDLQASRSKELQTLLEADQKDRESDWSQLTPEELQQIEENDLNRRKRVGEIFGEGCISTSKDYFAAYLIYQHGDIPDHYYQAFLFALRAAEHHHQEGGQSTANALDRYLISIGHRQLFGTQYFSESLGGCFCIEPVEASFPDTIRLSHAHQSLQERYDKLALINEGKQCSNQDCEHDLKPSPKGTVPGFW
ncbi:hypothetical protein [Legionella brunensis]|uniref:Uncharacterized protein n=1 Tax=Legionella brunensis TaxID=29422 RepID=A0A0W0SK05_9GAMM|nr:hypothetical protein [Legionella brunensis]KTC83719.1 hypothetical protein Lbru_1688 [Legionella brunensis]